MNLFKNEKGIGLIAFIIIFVLIILIIGVGIFFSKKAIKKTTLEDIKTNMLLIKGKAKGINEKYNFKDIENLVGVEYSFGEKIEEPEEEEEEEKKDKKDDKKKTDNKKEEDKKENEEEQEEIKEVQEINFNFSEELKGKIEEQGKSVYVWTQDDLNNNGLATITVNEDDFYAVEYESGEIYYSKGYSKDNKTYYSFTELQSL